MKKLSKIFLAIALVLVLAVPFVLAGCEIGGSNTKTEGIKIHTNFKTVYEVGEDLDVTNGKLVYTDEKGEETIVAITADMITSFSTATVGTRQMIVTYEGCTTLVDYEVYKIVDVQVGDLFYGDSIFAPEDWTGYFDYIKFNSSTQIDIESSSVTIENLPNNFFNNPLSATRTVGNRHAVYTIVAVTEQATMTTVITVVDENTINIRVTQPQGNIDISGQFTKYVG